MYLASSIISDKLLDPDSYIETLQQAGAYDRIYSEVLVDPALQDDLRELFGDLDLDPEEVAPEDVADLLRGIAPPDYLRSQTEGVIRSTVGYFVGDLEQLAVYVDLGPPLGNMEDVLLDYVDQRIDATPVVAIPGDLCSRNGASQTEKRFLAVVEELSTGNLPKSLPSWESADPACRELLFDQGVGPALASPTLPTETRSAFAASRREMKEEFLDGNIHGFFRLGARAATAPLLDAADREIRAGLDSEDMVDLVALIADLDPERTEAQLRTALGEVREGIIWWDSLGRIVALVMIVGGSAGIALVFAFNPKGMMRWPGLTLLIGGASTFALGNFLQSGVLNRLGDAPADWAAQAPDFPESVVDLSADLVAIYGQSLLSGVTGFSLTVLLVGAVLFVASFFLFLVRKLLP